MPKNKCSLKKNKNSQRVKQPFQTRRLNSHRRNNNYSQGKKRIDKV